MVKVVKSIRIDHELWEEFQKKFPGSASSFVEEKIRDALGNISSDEETNRLVRCYCCGDAVSMNSKKFGDNEVCVSCFDGKHPKIFELLKKD